MTMSVGMNRFPSKLQLIAAVLLIGVLAILCHLVAHAFSESAQPTPIYEGFKLLGCCVAVTVATLLLLFQSNATLQAETVERELSQQTQERLLAILETTPDFVGFADARDSRIVHINKAGRRMCGIGETEDVTKLVIADIVAEQTNQRIREEIIPAAVRDGVWTGEAVFRRRDGRDVPVMMVGMAHRSATGEVDVFSTISRDMTEHNRAEAALRDSEARHRTLFESSADAVMTAAPPSWKFTSCNPAALRIFGVQDEADFTSLGPWQLSPEMQPDGRPSAEKAKEMIETAMREGSHFFEWTHRRLGGNDFPATVLLSRMELDGKALIQATVRDITQLKLTQDALSQLNAQLEQRVQDRTAELEAANKELEAFSYSASHDLRAPLRSIAAFSELLLEESCDRLDAEGRDRLKRIHAASQRATQLVNDLLGFSRALRAEMHREPVDLSAVARDVAAELHEQQPNRSVAFAIADGVTAEGDPSMLRVVLTNLLGNAWEFSSKRAAAVIEFGQQTGQPTVFFVRDNGVGFDMANADKLFAPFHRLHDNREFPGTGIGLSTVERIIRRHGGRIWAESEVDKGATFYFMLGEETRRLS